MIDISKGRYWDLPLSLISGCTPCSPGCAHCWAAAMEHRFHTYTDSYGLPYLTDDRKFVGTIIIHPERLNAPLKRKKPTVFSLWNDLFHEDVPDQFRIDAYRVMARTPHTYLVLSKRPQQMAAFRKTLDYYNIEANHSLTFPLGNVYHGLTICTQREADEKIPIFLQVPGKKFLSIEPMLGEIDLEGIKRPGGQLSDKLQIAALSGRLGYPWRNYAI